MGESGWWKGLGRRLAELLYPRAANCLCCGDPRLAELEDCLCPRCRKEIKEYLLPGNACKRCLSPMRQGKPCGFCASPLMKPLQRVYAPYRYGGPVRMLIVQLKFNACGEAAPLLGGAMADALSDRDFDCVTPVPLHPLRLRQRGFNQALLLCRELEARTGIPVQELLRRNRYRRPQSLTPREKRAQNVAGVFSAGPQAQGLRVLLVDDVRTTGSTAQACAQALLRAGAESVSLCVAAVVFRRQKAGKGPSAYSASPYGNLLRLLLKRSEREKQERRRGKK